MSTPPKILIVDDNRTNIKVVANTLKQDHYDISFAEDGAQALNLLSEQLVDVILLDVMMPKIDGYEVCAQLKKQPRYQDIPIIFLTAKTDEASILKGFECGGQDYITKPFISSELRARVRTMVKIKTFEDAQQQIIEEALSELKILNEEIISTQREVVFTMGSIAETRSKETGEHVRRVAEYSKLLALLSGMEPTEAEIFKMASPMHDIGKVGIPDAILNKPGKLTADEFEIMKTHAQLGYEMLKHSQKAIMKTAATLAGEHHEKWDGSGYPRQLKGNAISLYGRITAIADVFDALGSDRCYKKSWPDERIFTLLKEQRGQHFDPTLIDHFFAHLDDFLAIRNQYRDML